MNRVILSFIIIIILLGIGGGVYYFIGKKSPTKTSTPTSSSSALPSSSSSPTSSASSSASPGSTGGISSIMTSDPAAELTAEKHRFDVAIEKAKTWPIWKDSAQFTGLFINLDPKLEINSGNEIFVFDTPEDPNNHYTISVSQLNNNALRALIPILDYQGSLLPINRSFWQSSDVDAVQMAMKNGGQEFMNSNSTTSVDVNLIRTDPNSYLYWTVVIHTTDATNNFTFKMDANTKVQVK